jgi:uncharacterized membrane protein
MVSAAIRALVSGINDPMAKNLTKTIGKIFKDGRGQLTYVIQH